VTSFPEALSLDPKFRPDTGPNSGSPTEAVEKLTPHVWWPGWLWFAGIIVFATRACVSRLWLLAYRRRHLPVTDEVFLRRIAELARRLNLRKPLRVTQSSRLAGPIVFGIFRGEICLPQGFAGQFKSTQQEVMLAHELAHLAANDPAWYCLSDMVAALWWWNPLTWWARRQLQSTTEQAADEASLLVEDGPGTLAECLVQIGHTLSRPRSSTRLGIEGNGYKSSLGRRVSRLLSLADHSPRTIGRGKATLLHFGSMCLLLLLVIASSGWTSREQSLAAMAWDALATQEQPQPLAQTTSPKKESLPVHPYVPGPPEVDPETGLPVTNVLTGLPITNNSGSATLHTRWFKVDPTIFLEGIKNWDTFVLRAKGSKASVATTNSSDSAV
jgi:beta-lactamase regulating signal transducer with metallopeptidase domain